MTELRKVGIADFFGPEFTDVASRQRSYDFLEACIASLHTDWTMAPDSDEAVIAVEKRLKGMSDQQFAFLLCHTGFIPETYKPDSSQETLYTKLVELLVKEWAVRIGFHRSLLPKTKSSTEDITIADDSNIIVADAKSFRLGRSQKAPNVKDALKQGDIAKWLSAHPENKRVGGLVTFPSQHDWQEGSDFYLYLTDPSSPIAMLFYEHMAYILLSGIKANQITGFLRRYEQIFGDAEIGKKQSRLVYLNAVQMHLIDEGAFEFRLFEPVAKAIIREKVAHTIAQLEQHLIQSRHRISTEIERTFDPERAKAELIDVHVRLVNEDLIRQLDNIKKFRAY